LTLAECNEGRTEGAMAVGMMMVFAGYG